MKPKYHSNSDIFARRGNPWVSDREGREGYGRNVDTEDPDLDCFTRARMAEHPYTPTRTGLHADIAPTAARPGKSITQSPARRFASINAKLQRELRKLDPIVVPDTKSKPAPPSLGKTGVIKTGKRYYLFAHTKEGEDIEADRDLLKSAQKSFDRFCERNDIVTAELWNAWEGKMIQSYTAGGGRRMLSLTGGKEDA
jgi:hypothetical protein